MTRDLDKWPDISKLTITEIEGKQPCETTLIIYNLDKIPKIFN